MCIRDSYLSALLVLDPDAAPAWAARHGKQGSDLAALAADEDLRAEVAEQLEAVNGGCPESRGTWVAIRDEAYAAAPTVSGAWTVVAG